MTPQATIKYSIMINAVMNQGDFEVFCMSMPMITATRMANAPPPSREYVTLRSLVDNLPL